MRVVRADLDKKAAGAPAKKIEDGLFLKFFG
jgi:hypothetical protein